MPIGVYNRKIGKFNKGIFQKGHLATKGSFKKGHKNVYFGKENPKTPQNKLLRGSLRFKLWRKEVFERDNWTCWICEMKGFTLHPHHLKSFALYPKLRFKKSNGLTLCEFCHRTYTDFGSNYQ